MDVVQISWMINVILLTCLHLIVVADPTVTGRTNIDSIKFPSIGTIMSPNFPDPYKQGTQHLYRLQADKSQIDIKFISFDIGTLSKKQCVDDYLRIIYADDSTQRFCGRSNFSLTAYSMLTLELFSNNNRLAGKRYRGFQANYNFTLIKPCAPRTFALKTTPSRTGTFTTPAYPVPGYPPGIECHYHIVGSRGYSVNLLFHDFDVYGDHDNCYKDFVDIFAINLSKKEHTLMTRICGKYKNYRIHSNTTNLYLRFISITNKHHRGFRVDYQFVRDKVDPPAKSKNATKKMPMLEIFQTPKRNRTLTRVQSKVNGSRACGPLHREGFSGRLKFSGADTGYFNECLWQIKVPRSWEIVIIFVDFRVGEDGLCKDRYILLYDEKPLTNKKPIAKLCGRRDKIGKEFTAYGRTIFVKLVSQNGGLLPSEKFQINWSAYLRSGSIGRCRGFMCAGGTTCIDRARLSCRELPQRCLHESVKCDGIRNCGTEDDSDENGCISDAVRYSVLGATCFLFLLFLVSTVAILKSRASERTCSCTSTASPQQNVNSPTDRGEKNAKALRVNGSINRDLMEMSSLSTTRPPTSSGLASSRHRYSYEVIVNQEALRAAEEPAM